MTLGQSAYLIWWTGPDRTGLGNRRVDAWFRRFSGGCSFLIWALTSDCLPLFFHGFSVIVAGLSLGRWRCGSTVFVNSPQFTLILYEIGPSSIPSIPGGGWIGTGG